MLNGGYIDKKSSTTLDTLQKALGFSEKLKGGVRLIKLLGVLAHRYGSLELPTKEGMVSCPANWATIVDDLVHLASDKDLPFVPAATEIPNKLVEGLLEYEKGCTLNRPNSCELILGLLFWRLICESCDEARRAQSTLEKHSTNLRLAHSKLGDHPVEDYRVLLLKDIDKKVGKFDATYATRIYEVVKNHKWPDSAPKKAHVEFLDSIKTTFELRTQHSKQQVKGRGDPPPNPKKLKRRRKKSADGKSRKRQSGSLSRRLISSRLKLTANSTVIMTPLEKAAFIAQVEIVINEAEEGRPNDTELWVLLLSSYLYGRDIDHWFKIPFGAPDSIDNEGNFQLALYLPQISTEEYGAHWTAPAKSFWAPAHDYLRRLLSHCTIKNGGTVAESIGVDPDEALKDIRNILINLRKGGSLKLTPSMIARQREVHLSVLTESPLLTHLLIGDSRVKPPVGTHYQYISIEYLRRISEICSAYLLDGSIEGNPNRHRQAFCSLVWRPTEVGLGFAGFYLDDDYLKSLIEKVVKKTIEVMASEASIIVKHNAFADFTFLRLMFGQGVRPVRDPFPRRDWLSVERRMALHQDKSDHFDPAFRVSCLTDTDICHITAYDDHLVGLATRILKLGTDFAYVASIIYTLSRGARPSEPVPYLFRLSDDGKRFVSYRSNDLVRILNTSTFIPQNFPRKWLYTSLVHEGVPDVVIRSIFGHATTSANLLGSDSFYTLAGELTQIRPLIQRCVGRLGWQAIKGLGKYGESKLQLTRTFPPSQSVTEFKRLGYEQRIKTATRFEASVNKTLRECELFIEDRLNLAAGSLDQSKNYTEKSYRLVSAVIKGIREQAKSRIQRRKLDHAELKLRHKIKFASKFNLKLRDYITRTSISSDRLVFNEKLFLDYVIACSVRDRHIQRLSKRQDPSANQLRGEIALTAALCSFLGDRVALEKLAVFDLSKAEVFGGKVYIELPSASPEQPYLRWRCDQFNLWLIAQLQGVSTKPNISVIKKQLAKILVECGADLGNADPFEKLSQLSGYLMTFEVGGAWHQHCRNANRHQLLKPDAFTLERSRGLSIPKAAPENLSFLSIETEPAVQLATPEVTKRKNQVVEIQRCLRKFGDGESSKSDEAKQEAREELQHLLLTLRISATAWDVITQLLCIWLEWMAEHGTQETTNPAISTLKTYFYSIARPLYRAAGDSDITEFEELEFQTLYLKAAKHTKRKDPDIFWRQIMQFHAFLENSLFTQTSVNDLDLIERHVKSELPTCRAAYVPVNLYLDGLNKLLSAAGIHEEDKIYVGSLLLFGRRFGLRISEVRFLQLKDLQFSCQFSNFYVRTSQRVKTKASIKLIPLINQLDEAEVAFLKWVIESAREHVDRKETNPYLACLFLDDKSRRLKCEKLCRFVIKWMIGDSKVSHHDLRHSWATDYCKIMLKSSQEDGSFRRLDDTPGLNTYNSYRSLMHISNAIGHSDTRTLASTYFNRGEDLIADWYQPDITTMLSLRGFSNFSGFSYHTLAKRCRSKNIALEHYTEVLTPKDIAFLSLSETVPFTRSEQDPPWEILTVGEVTLSRVLEWLLLIQNRGIQGAKAVIPESTHKEFDLVVARAEHVQNILGLRFIPLTENEKAIRKISAENVAWLRRSIASLSKRLSRIQGDNEMAGALSDFLNLWLGGYSSKRPDGICLNSITNLKDSLKGWSILRPSGIQLQLNCVGEIFDEVELVHKSDNFSSSLLRHDRPVSCRGLEKPIWLTKKKDIGNLRISLRSLDVYLFVFYIFSCQAR